MFKPLHRFGFLTLLVLLCGCELRQVMYNQPKYKDFRPSDFFSDGRGARIPPAGTVARRGPIDTHLEEARVGGQPVSTFPFPVTKEVMERGANRYRVYCLPCHGFTGDGNGMVVQRGFQRPPSFHQDRLRNAGVSHFFTVITTGLGNMSSYHLQISPEDRWSIIAYIRALQLSQNARVSDVPSVNRHALEGEGS